MCRRRHPRGDVGWINVTCEPTGAGAGSQPEDIELAIANKPTNGLLKRSLRPHYSPAANDAVCPELWANF